MPVITVKAMEGVLSDDDKARLAGGITDAFVEVAGEPARAVTTVLVEEVASGSWMMGGDLLTTNGVKELLAGHATV